MATANWSAPGTESTNVAGASLDSRATGTASGIMVDITNGTGRDLYVSVWLVLGSITTTAGASMTARLRRKRGST